MWEALVTLLGFVAFMLWRDNKSKRQEIEQKVEEADKHAKQEQVKAERTYQERLKQARKDVDASVAARKRTGNPVQDLRDRLDRK